MRNPERIRPILDELERVWNKYPDQRFGQLLQNIIGQIATKHKVHDIWFPEDDKWLEWLKDE